MTLGPDNAFSLAVAVTLLLFAGLLLVRGRRRADGIALSFFLGLVALNFLFNVVADGRGPEAIPWRRAAAVTLALDPFYLLHFVTLHPYKRRPRSAIVALTVSGTLGLVGTLAVISVWDPTLPESGPPRWDGHYLMWATIIGNMLFAYASAWVLSLHSASTAPTPLLRRQARWLVLAVGVMVLPRLGMLWRDLDLHHIIGSATPVPSSTENVGLSVANILLPAALFLWARSHARRAGAPQNVRLLRVIDAAGAMGLLLLVLQIAAPILNEWARLAPTISTAYSLRWVVFAAILAQGMLQYEMVTFRGSAERTLAAIGVLAGMVAIGVVSHTLLASQQIAGAVTLLVPIGMAAAFAMPLTMGVRAMLARMSRPHADESSDRRLAMYRAALEQAWAAGPPAHDIRDQLERDRRSFGVSAGEARALEHVVRGELGAQRDGIRRGEELVPGIVVERELGRGSHGVVLLAWDHANGEHVVLKVLSAEERANERTRERLWAEVRSLERLQHPHVVRLRGFHIVHGRVILVLNHVAGASLADRLTHGPLSDEDVRAVAGDLLAALAAAHAAGIVHRDVKPGNVLLDEDGRAHLADFGLATHADTLSDLVRTGSVLLSPGTVAGTVAYLSPEQARGEPATLASDVYALGLVILQALTGRHPLDLEGYDVPTALGILREPHIDWSAVPEEWRGPLTDMLAVDPVARPTAAALARRLDEADGDPRRVRSASARSRTSHDGVRVRDLHGPRDHRGSRLAVQDDAQDEG